ncbi:MAG: nuclear transport factor 2 family protein [Gemmatimonadota bacterium]
MGTDGPNPAIAQVSARVTRYFEAISTGDSAAVADGLADDYRLVGVSGALWNKSQRIQELSANGPAFGTVTPSEVEIRLFDGTAVVIGLATIFEPTDTIRERFTQVWVLDRTRWRMVSGQITAVETPLPSPPPQP